MLSPQNSGINLIPLAGRASPIPDEKPVIKTGDCRTKETAFWTFTAQILGSAIDIGTTFDTLFGAFLKIGDIILEKSFLGIFSWYGLSLGIAVGLIAAIGSTYCHFYLNTNHEEDVSLPEEKCVPFSKLDKFALTGDWGSHFNEIAIAVASFGLLINEKTRLGLPFLLPWLIMSFGGAIRGAYADFRTCMEGLRRRNNPILKNTHDNIPETKSLSGSDEKNDAKSSTVLINHGKPFPTDKQIDWRTWENALWTFLALNLGTLDLAFFIDQVLDNIFGTMTKAFFGIFSYYAFVPAVLIGLLCSIGATYCHIALNANHQEEEESSPATVNNVPLTTKQTFLLIGDRISHINEIAVPLVLFGAFLAEKIDISPWIQLGWQAFSFFAGWRSSYADYRTCRKSLCDYNNQRFFVKKDTSDYVAIDINSANQKKGSSVDGYIKMNP